MARLAFVCVALLTAPVAAQGSRVTDVGIFPDLDANVTIALPASLDRAALQLRVDRRHRLAVLLERDQALKAFSLTRDPGPSVRMADLLTLLPSSDAAELRERLPVDVPVAFASGSRTGDADDDGIPDALDVLMGARKLVANRAEYKDGYHRITYPGGDVPRTIGVCTDTIVRALRNAGIDLQERVAKDVQRVRAAYRSITRPDTNIDHRRVKNVVVWFRRHFQPLRDEPLRPGDIVFLDTFPGKPGPDHVGIVSDRIAPSGKPMVINNWTVGYHEGEMDLLSSIPVTDRFRLP